MRLPTIQMHLLVLLQQSLFFLCFYPHFSCSILEMFRQCVMVAWGYGILNSQLGSRILFSNIHAHGRAPNQCPEER